MRRSLFILAVAIGRLEAQPPAILQNGLFNSAGRMAGALPGAALAPGSRFTIHGVRLGTDIRTTVVTVRSGGHSAAARLLTVNATEILGILPALQPGDATATVTRGGESSLAFSFRVAPMAVGLYSANRLGWGHADLARPAGAKPSLAPGEVVRLRATGVGTGLHLKLFVGGSPASILSAGPKANQPGTDEIAFRIPDGVAQGCYVPAYAQTPGGLVSNIVTLPVARGGGACAVPEAWPIPGAQSGLVLLSRFSMLLETRPGDWETHDHESIEATFVAGNGSPLVMPLHLLPPAGTCTGLAGVYQSGGGIAELIGLASDASGARGLDAGEEIALAGPGGKLNLVAGPEGFYRARLSKRSTRTFLLPGDLQIASPGGTAVAPFTAAVRTAAPLTWKNRDQLAVVDRRNGVRVEWKDADPRRPVLIAALSVDRLSTAAYACLCVAPPGTAAFTIPAAMLANLPPTGVEAGLPQGLLLIAQSASGGSARFQARGLATGTVLYLSGSGRSVSYR